MTKSATKFFRVLFFVLSFGCLHSAPCLESAHGADANSNSLISAADGLYKDFKSVLHRLFLEGNKYVRMGAGFTGALSGSIGPGTTDTDAGLWGSLAGGHLSTREAPSLSKADRILKDIITQKRRNALAVLRVLQVPQIPRVEDITTLQKLLLYLNENNSAEAVKSHLKAFLEDIEITQKVLLFLTDEVTNIAQLKELKIKEGQEGISGFQTELEVSYRCNNLGQTDETPTIGGIVTSVPTYGSLQQYSIMLNASYLFFGIDKNRLSPFLKIGAGPMA